MLKDLRHITSLILLFAMLISLAQYLPFYKLELSALKSELIKKTINESENDQSDEDGDSEEDCFEDALTCSEFRYNILEEEGVLRYDNPISFLNLPKKVTCPPPKI